MENDRASLLELGVRLMAEHYPGMTVKQAAIIQSGGIKTIWKIETDAGPVALKRIRKSVPTVRFTTAAQSYLAAKGALVPRIVPTGKGELFFVHEGHPLALYEWIDGRDLYMEEVAEHLCAGVRGLARFHRDTAGFVPPADGEAYDRMGEWPRHYREMREELARWKSESEQRESVFHQTYAREAERMIRLADLAIDLLAQSCYAEWVRELGPYGCMAHQDYGKGNALETDRGVYVLDLDNLAYDVPLRDLRKLIVKRMDYLERWDEPELDRIIGWYASEYPLTESQIAILYIDMLFPHYFYGTAKNPFKKGKRGEVDKLLESAAFERGKLPLLADRLGLDLGE